MRAYREHHYQFTHRYLPQRLWAGDSVLGILANPQNQAFLHSAWDQLRATTKGIELVDPAGLGYEAFWIGGEHLVFLVRLPTPERRTEAFFVAITTSPRVHYFTLERGEDERGNPLAYFCEWTPDMRRVNYSASRESHPSEETFIGLICERLAVPATIEAPSPAQCLGMGDEPIHVDTDQDELALVDYVEVDHLQDEAEEADSVDDPETAEACYRRIIQIAQARVGPRSSTATHAMRGLAYALASQQKTAESETVLLDLWRLCRRWRMLGHAETLFTIAALAAHYEARSDFVQAEELLVYNALLASLARGARSPMARLARDRVQHFQKRQAAASSPGSPSRKQLTKDGVSTTFGEFFQPWIGAFPAIGNGALLISKEAMTVAALEPAGDISEHPTAGESRIQHSIPWTCVASISRDGYRSGSLTIHLQDFRPRGAIYFAPRGDGISALEADIRARLV